MKKINWPIWPKYSLTDQKAVKKVAQSNRLFAGKKVLEFENKFKNFTNSRYAVAVGNATQGLHLSLAALNIGKGDEVITTPFSFISSASSILMQNAIPIFVDCTSETLSPDLNEIQKKITNRTKAIILVHPFGYAFRADKIKKLSKEYNLYFIEDASHAHGLIYKKKHAGTFGDIGVFSLHQRKSLSVGDGGIILTKKKSIEENLRKLRSFGHEELSYNYRMTEFAGALGSNRIKNLQKENKIRKQNAHLLDEYFNDNLYIKPVKPIPLSEPVYHKYLFRLNSNLLKCSLYQFSYEIQKKGIPLKKINENRNWDLLHRHSTFNPKTIPARGLPWLDRNYNGYMKKIRFYKKIRHPKIENIIDNELLELPIDPPVDFKLINLAIRTINEEIKKNII